ncbi:insulinase family protein [Candidatus Bipolaricaulota bacterium]|nr:insulinase family protein [Candidatus Bipolaricaulota bacterium]
MEELYPGLYAHRLPSGLYVLAEPLDRVRSVAVGVWVQAGSRDDPPGKEGLAHLMEHMAFKGTVRRSALEIAQAIDLLGGNLNGATGKESTFFYTTVLEEGLACALEILGEILTQPRLAPEDLERERAVILEEIREAEDDPQDVALRLLFSGLWPEGHPLGHPVLGTSETISSLGADEVRGFFRQHYRPVRMILAASGRFDLGRLLKEAERVWPAGADGELPRRVPPVPKGGLMVGERPIQQVHLAVGFPTVKAGAEERYGLEVLSTILGGGVSSRLFQRVREERGLVYTVASSTAYYTDAGVLMIYAAAEERRLPEVLELIWQEVRGMACVPPSREEVSRAVARLRAGFLLGLEDPSGRMFRLGTNAALGREITPIPEVERKLLSVTPEEVQGLAARFLKPELAALALVGPAADRLERLARPQLEVS